MSNELHNQAASAFRRGYLDAARHATAWLPQGLLALEDIEERAFMMMVRAGFPEPATSRAMGLATCLDDLLEARKALGLDRLSAVLPIWLAEVERWAACDPNGTPPPSPLEAVCSVDHLGRGQYAA